MHDRQSQFRTKFACGARILSCEPHDLISLKIRDNVASYQEYQALLEQLDHACGIRSRKLDGDFQGNGYLVANSKTQIIIVEHETGLEILYIAGSVASLIGLVPLVLRCWNVIREHEHHEYRRPGFRGIETRRLDSSDVLVEDENAALDTPWFEPLSVMNTAMLSAAEIIDAELVQIKAKLEAVEQRLRDIEGQALGRSDAKKAKAKRQGKKKLRKKRK